MDSRIKKLAIKPGQFSHVNLFHICLLFLLLNHFTMVLAQSVDGALTIPELVSQLQGEGYQILYSSSLVKKQLEVNKPREPNERKIDWLKRCLLHHALELQKQGEVYIIIQRQTDITPTTGAADATVDQQPSLIEDIIVTGSLHRIPRGDLAGSSYRLLAEDMAVVSSLGSDAMRLSLRLPGMASVGVSAKPHIRGGLQDELLVIQDSVELLEPFHLADYHSPYSTIDYLTIETVDFYTGGFPSRYGNRMSGVMDITSQWTDDKYSTRIGHSRFSSFINTQGSTNSDDSLKWMLSYRQGDLEDLTQYIETQTGEPEYEDATAKVRVQFNDNAWLSSGLSFATDDILFSDEEEEASSNIDSFYAWSVLDWSLREQLKSRFALSYLDYDRRKSLFSFEQNSTDELEALEPGEDDEDEILLDEDGEPNFDPTKGGQLTYQQAIKRLSLRNDYTLLETGILYEFGWQTEYNEAEYQIVSSIDRGVLADIIGTERIVQIDRHLAPEGWSAGMYAAAEFELFTSRLLAQPSLRWDFQDYYLGDNEHQLSPRLGFSYEFDADLRLRMTVGRYYQPEGIHELQVLDGEVRFFTPQRSDQAILGVEWRKGDFQFVGDIYYKHYADLKKRYENMFNPFVLLPEMEPDRVGITPDSAIARGFDLDAKYVCFDDLTINLRYSYIKAEDKINNKWVPRRWSQDHTVNGIVIWKRESYSFSAAFSWHSGWRTSELPAAVDENTTLPIETILNNGELGDYFSLDVSVRKNWNISRSQLEIYADISNVTQHKNSAGIDYDIEIEDGLNILEPDKEILLPRITSVGFTVSF